MAYMCRKGPRPCLSFITATPCVMFDPLAFSEATDVLGGQAARHSSTFGNPSKIATCSIRLYGLSRNNLFTQRAVIPRADQARQYTPLAASSNGISRPSQGKHARPEGLLRRPLFQSERGVIMKRLDQPSMPARKQIRTPIDTYMFSSLGPALAAPDALSISTCRAGTALGIGSDGCVPSSPRPLEMPCRCCLSLGLSVQLHEGACLVYHLPLCCWYKTFPILMGLDFRHAPVRV